MPNDPTTLVILIAALWTLFAFCLVVVALGCVTYALVLLVRSERPARAPAKDRQVEKPRVDPQQLQQAIQTPVAPAAAQDVHPALAFKAGRFGGGLKPTVEPTTLKVGVGNGDISDDIESAWQDAPSDRE